MSHFCVMVIGNDYEGQLERFDENLELPMHKVATKEDLIRDKRESLEYYKNTIYAKFLKDPEAYKANCSNDKHIEYLEVKFPKLLESTDEELYQRAIRSYKEDIEDGCTYCEIHSDGSLWKTSNENAKWDWYVRGGRYRGRLKLKEPNPNAPLYTGWQYEENGEDKEYERLLAEGYCDQALVSEISNLQEIIPFAIVKEREWYESGKMGWWAVVTNEKDPHVWDEEVKKLIAELPQDTLITMVDCHI